MKTFYASCLALAAAGAVFIAGPAATASAQSATNLKCRGCVGAKDIGKKAVTTKHIKDGTITPADLSAAAKPATGNYAGGDQSLALTSSSTVVRSVTVDVPAQGLVIVNASGYAFANTATPTIVRCSIGADAVLDGGNMIYMQIAGVNAFDSDAFGATRAFPVTAGDNTFNLVCDEFQGDGKISDTQMTAIFFPAVN